MVTGGGGENEEERPKRQCERARGRGIFYSSERWRSKK
jgi:hypothetical protein